MTADNPQTEDLLHPRGEGRLLYPPVEAVKALNGLIQKIAIVQPGKTVLSLAPTVSD